MKFEDKDTAYYKIAKQVLSEIKAIILCPCNCYYYDNSKALDGDVNELSLSYIKERYSEYDDYDLFIKYVEQVMFKAGNKKICPFCGLQLVETRF